MKKPKPYEAKKPFVVHIRLNREINDMLNEACDKIGFEKSFLCRLLIVTSLKRLREDASKVGWDNLEYTARHI